MRRWLLLLFILIATLLLNNNNKTHITAQWIERHDWPPASSHRLGRCIPASTIQAPRGEIPDVLQPICSAYLASTTTHVWVDDLWVDQTTTDTTDQCFMQSQWVTDDIVRIITNTFTASQPRPNCQRMLLSTLCLFLYPRCEPELDGPEYVTEVQNRPCSWLCTTLTVGGDICNVADKTWLASRGVDLTNPTTSIPLFDCNRREWGTNRTNCLAPTRIPAIPTYPRCEIYKGAFCRSVFGADTKIFLEAGQSQADLEAALIRAVDPTFLPVPYNSRCAKAQLLFDCMVMFRECMDVQLQEQLEVSKDQWVDTNRKVPHPLVLEPPTVTCHLLQNECTHKSPFYSFVYHERPDLPWVRYSPNCTHPHPSSALSCVRPQSFYNALPVLQFLPKSQTVAVSYYFWSYGQMSRRLSARTFAMQDSSFGVVVPNLGTCPTPLVTPKSIKRDAILDHTDVGDQFTLFGGQCALPCPYAQVIYTPEELHWMERLTLILTAVAMCTSALFAIILKITSADPNNNHVKGKSRSDWLLWYSISCTCVPLIIFIGTEVGTSSHQSVHHSHCTSDVAYAHMTGWPLVQGMAIIYFILVHCHFWFLQPIELLLRVVLRRQYRLNTPHRSRKDKAFHLFVWLTPLINIAALITAEQIGYDAYLPFAFLATDRRMKSSPPNLAWAFFFGPIIALAIAGFAIAIISAVVLAYNKCTHPMSPPNPKLRCWHRFNYAVEQLGFVFLMIIFLGFTLFHATLNRDHMPRWSENLVDFAICKLLAGTTCPTQYRMEPETYLIVLIGICSPAFALVLTYVVIQRDITALWLRFLYIKLGWDCLRPLLRKSPPVNQETPFYALRPMKAVNDAKALFYVNEDGDLVLNRDLIDLPIPPIKLPPNLSDAQRHFYQEQIRENLQHYLEVKTPPTRLLSVLGDRSKSTTRFRPREHELAVVLEDEDHDEDGESSLYDEDDDQLSDEFFSGPLQDGMTEIHAKDLLTPKTPRLPPLEPTAPVKKSKQQVRKKKAKVSLDYPEDHDEDEDEEIGPSEREIRLDLMHYALYGDRPLHRRFLEVDPNCQKGEEKYIFDPALPPVEEDLMTNFPRLESLRGLDIFITRDALQRAVVRGWKKVERARRATKQSGPSPRFNPVELELSFAAELEASLDRESRDIQLASDMEKEAELNRMIVLQQAIKHDAALRSAVHKLVDNELHAEQCDEQQYLQSLNVSGENFGSKKNIYIIPPSPAPPPLRPLRDKHHHNQPHTNNKTHPLRGPIRKRPTPRSGTPAHSSNDPPPDQPDQQEPFIPIAEVVECGIEPIQEEHD